MEAESTYQSSAEAETCGRGRLRGRQVGLEENDIGVFATAQTNRSNTKPGFLGGVLNNDGKEIQFEIVEQHGTAGYGPDQH